MTFSEHQNIGSSGNLDFPKTNKPVESVIECIQKSLEQFANEFKGTPISNEAGLTQELCDILNDNAGSCSYWFHHQNLQDTASGRSPSTDIGIKTREEMVIHTYTYVRRKAFFELEAKRLPTPGKSREKEYVIGNENKMGGIERFKIGKHGRNVLYGGLIGFVQQNGFDFWLKVINGWIEEQFDIGGLWNEADKLVLKKSDLHICQYFSRCKRRLGVASSIGLFHWWVKMS